MDNKDNVRIRVVVACTYAPSDGPDFYFCKVECRQDQYENGDHYDCARLRASGEGFEPAMVCFDENDGPKFLFDHFVWESASILDITTKGLPV